jgi:hypothetical protein
MNCYVTAIKIGLAIGAALALCIGCMSNGQGPSQSPGHAELWFNGSGDIRWDPVARIFSGRVRGTAFAGGRDHFLGVPWPVISLADGKHRLIAKNLDFDQELELDAVLPWWVKPLYPEAVADPSGQYFVATLANGDVIRISALQP